METKVVTTILKLLITGASGLFGSKLAELALTKDHEVYSSYNQHFPQWGTPIKMDLLDNNACKKAFERIKPEIVVHSAALTNLDLCEKNRELAWKVNVEGTKKILNLCKRHSAFLIFISTDYVFDGNKGFYSEKDEPFPINYYGYTKLKAEEIIKGSLEEYCIIRTSVIFGSRPATGKINFALWVLESLEQNRKIEIVTDQINSPTLNTSLASMTLEVAERQLTEVLHLAGATPISRYEFARLLAQEFNLNQELIRPTTSDKINWIAKRPKNTSLNVTKALNLLKNKPICIREAVRQLKSELSLYKKNNWTF